MSPMRKHSTLSRKSSLGNAASRFTRAWIVSLKLRVKGMVDLLVHLSLFVVLPSGLRVLNVLLLPFLGSTSEQDDQAFAVFAEINAEARTEIDSALVNPAANALHIGEVALRQPRNRHSHLGCGWRAQAFKPFGIRAAVVPVEVFENLD